MTNSLEHEKEKTEILQLKIFDQENELQQANNQNYALHLDETRYLKDEIISMKMFHQEELQKNVDFVRQLNIRINFLENVLKSYKIAQKNNSEKYTLISTLLQTL